MRLTEPVLDITQAVAGYGDLDILHGIDLQVAGGVWTTIIGANGAGKSTLLKLIAGTLPCRSGRLRFEGRDVTASSSVDRLRQGIGLVPQGRCNFPMLSVAENLTLGMFTRRLGRAQKEDELATMAERFPLCKQRWSTLAGNLSGGEQQLLEMAMVLLAKPRLMLLDEPSLGLSPKAMAQVFEVIRELTRSGLSVLMVEQNAQQALAQCDRAVVLELGQVGLTGAARDILDHPQIRQHLLGL